MTDFRRKLSELVTETCFFQFTSIYLITKNMVQQLDVSTGEIRQNIVRFFVKGFGCVLDVRHLCKRSCLQADDIATQHLSFRSIALKKGYNKDIQESR